MSLESEIKALTGAMTRLAEGVEKLRGATLTLVLATTGFERTMNENFIAALKAQSLPARAHWLKQQRPDLAAHWPQARCPQYESWLRDLNPGRVTLVYASDFAGNPSSLFGLRPRGTQTSALVGKSKLDGITPISGEEILGVKA